jgi:hypothetical protein
VCLLSDIIQHFVDKKMDFDSSYVYEDIKRSIEFVHQSGKMHDKILAEPSKYLVKNVSLYTVLNPPFPLCVDYLSCSSSLSQIYGHMFHRLRSLLVFFLQKRCVVEPMHSFSGRLSVFWEDL